MLGTLSRVRYYRERVLNRQTRLDERGWLPAVLQIRLYRFSRNASSLGDGRHFLIGAGLSPARFQKASRTSRFICKLLVMRLVVATDAWPR